MSRKVLVVVVLDVVRRTLTYGEQNLSSHAKELVGDRYPRSHEFSVQLRAMDADRSGHGLGLPVLIALCVSLMERSQRAASSSSARFNLGGSVETIPNPVAVAELAVEGRSTTPGADHVATTAS
jgi:ATP-dependent Lon protease